MLLCLDVGFRNTGWVVFNKGKARAWGCIRTQKTKVKTTRVSDDNAYCAGVIARELRKVVKDHSCQAIIGEMPTGGSISSRPANQMGIALGVVACFVEMMDLPAEWVTPQSVKKVVTGKQNASKEQMMDRIRKTFPDCEFPKAKVEFEHIADAFGAYMASEGSNLVKMYG